MRASNINEKYSPIFRHWGKRMLMDTVLCTESNSGNHDHGIYFVAQVWFPMNKNVLVCFIAVKKITVTWSPHKFNYKASLKYMWPLLLTWFNFNPSMDK